MCKIGKGIKMLFGAFLACGILFSGKNAALANTMETAIPMAAGQAVAGVIPEGEESEFFVFTATENGYVSFDFAKPLSDKESSFIMSIYDANAIEAYASYRDTKSAFSTEQVVVAAGNVYYLRVKNYSHGNGIDFTVTANFIPYAFVESEYNETTTTATQLVANIPTYGTSFNSKDEDCFSFVAPNNGIVTFDFTTVDMYVDFVPKWRVKVIDKFGNNIYEVCQKDASVSYVMSKGEVYYLCVSSYSKNELKKYQITPLFQNVTYTEKETNDSVTKATKMTIGKTYYGSLSSKQDQDFYKITALKDGVVTIKFKDKSNNLDASAVWNFIIYDSSKNELVNVKTTHENNTDNCGSLQYVLKKKQTIYVCLKNYSNTKNVTYSLGTSFKANKYIEKENNNTIAKATKIVTNKTYSAVLGEQKTSDYFMVKPTKSGKYKVAIRLKEDLTYPYAIRIYDSNKRVIATSKAISLKGTLKFTATAGKKYYVEVYHAKTWSGTSSCSLYTLKVSK